MIENTEIDISEYYQTPLSSLVLPDNYAKLIKRITKLNGFNNSLGEMFVVESVGDIVALEPYRFSQCKGVGNNYIDSLIEFKKELPYFLSKLKKEPDFVFQDDIFTSIDNSYDFETPIYQLSLSPKYEKLIKRISAVMNNIETVQDIIDIEIASFSTLPYVGKLYSVLLINLQNALAHTNINQPNIDIKRIEKELPPQIMLSIEQLETLLNILALPTQYQKLIKRISVVATTVVTVQDIFNINLVDFAKLPTVGTLYVNSLIEFKKKLPEILEAQSKKSALFKDNYSIEFNEIDNILIEDVENYLWTLNEMKMDIALSRWGFNHQHESLEEVGKRYKVTRERIRQLEKPINTNFLLHLTIQSKVLWANIREKMTEDLTVLLPNLAKCFATDKLFYAFIELCCQVKSDSVRKIVFTKINPKIINSLFCINPSPISQEIIINRLVAPE